MWQPNRAQWSIIWLVSAVLVLAWPPDEGRSLGTRVVNWAVDPGGSLPVLPGPLPMGMDDDGDVVPAHDAQEAEYYRVYQSSSLARWRLTLKRAGDPFDRSTLRQLLAGIAIFGALGVWKLNRPSAGAETR